MLIGIPKNISPSLLKILSEMGHGDEIVIADGNFPSMSIGTRVVDAQGSDSVEMLESVLQLFPLDQYDDEHFILMEKVPGDQADVSVWDEFEEKLKAVHPDTTPVHIERFAFYERAKKAYAVIATGEQRQYANIILKKGCVI